MSKDPYFTGQPIFTQLLSFVDKASMRRISNLHGSDRYYKKFMAYDHLVTMLYAIYHKCSSLREVTTGLQACFHKLHHIGMDYCPRRSTLSDANSKRSYEVFEHFYRDIYRRYRHILPDSRSKTSWFSRLYIVDSTTISLFKEILKNAGRTPCNGRRKGGIKVHALTKAEEDVPCLVKMNAAASHDVPFIQGLQLPIGSIIVFDKAYVDYAQYDLWTKQQVDWVTRLKRGAQYQTIDERSIDKAELKQGVLADMTVVLGHQTHLNVTRVQARLIQYYDHQNQRLFSFITNNTNLKASVIAQIYRHRWQIETLFKRIKQNYPIQYFLGDNENAIQIQIWCILIADLLLKVIQRIVRRRWSFSNLSSMIRIHLMSYTNLLGFLENPDKLLINNIRIKNKGPTLFD
jgi:hypothetical protein